MFFIGLSSSALPILTAFIMLMGLMFSCSPAERLANRCIKHTQQSIFVQPLNSQAVQEQKKTPLNIFQLQYILTDSKVQPEPNFDNRKLYWTNNYYNYRFNKAPPLV